MKRVFFVFSSICDELFSLTFFGVVSHKSIKSWTHYLILENEKKNHYYFFLSTMEHIWSGNKNNYYFFINHETSLVWEYKRLLFLSTMKPFWSGNKNYYYFLSTMKPFLFGPGAPGPWGPWGCGGRPPTGQGPRAPGGPGGVGAVAPHQGVWCGVAPQAQFTLVYIYI